MHRTVKLKFKYYPNSALVHPVVRLLLCGHRYISQVSRNLKKTRVQKRKKY